MMRSEEEGFYRRGNSAMDQKEHAVAGRCLQCGGMADVLYRTGGTGLPLQPIYPREGEREEGYCSQRCLGLARGAG